MGFSARHVLKVKAKPTFFLVLGMLGVMLVSGCYRSAEVSSVGALPKTVEPRQKDVAPFGVYDVQSRHGKGQWRKSPEALAR